MKHILIAVVSLFCQYKAAATGDSLQVKTVDGVIQGLYASISGEQGAARNWDLFRSLFAPQARMMIAAPASDGKKNLVLLSPEDYITRSGPRLVESGFMEKELHRITETYGGVTHVFSTYESRLIRNGKPETVRGINSIQLFFDGTRYYIVSIFWEADTRRHEVPAKYLQ